MYILYNSFSFFQLLFLLTKYLPKYLPNLSQNLIYLPKFSSKLPHKLFFSSSPSRSPGIDNETMLMNNVYKERFPKAVQQMDQLLQQYIEDLQGHGHMTLSDLQADGAASFIYKQVFF